MRACTPYRERGLLSKDSVMSFRANKRLRGAGKLCCVRISAGRLQCPVDRRQ